MLNLRNFTKILLGIHIGAYLILNIATFWFHVGLAQYMELTLPALFHGEIWRILTFTLVQTDPLSFIFTVIMLYAFPQALLTWYSERDLVFTYVIACLAGVALWVATQTLHAQPSVLIGVAPVLLTWFSLYCFRNWYNSIEFYIFIIPVRLPSRLLFGVIAAYQGIMWLFREIPNADSLSNSANVGGLVFAYLYHFQPWQNIRLPQRKKEVVAKPILLSPAEQIDAILEKISEKGINSISKAERAVLEQYKK